MYSSNRPKSKQQLITPLESRRLMSISAGMDHMPGASAATQYAHSFGFEHTLGAYAQMPAPAHFAPGASGFMGTDTSSEFNSNDANSMDAQFARAIAQGTPPNFGDTGADNGIGLGGDPGIDHSAHPNTLATMYTELSTSTVISIDDATSTATTSATLAALTQTDDTTFPENLDASAASTFAATTSTGNAAMNQTVSISATAFTAASTTAETATAFSPNIAPAITLPASLMLGKATTSVNAELVIPPRFIMQNVEQELLTVGNLASEMIAQLGRNIAIEMSHLQSDLGLDGMTQQITTHWDGWRSAAAVAGAAIATIVYVQSEADREKPKAVPTFSTSLIQAIPA